MPSERSYFVESLEQFEEGLYSLLSENLGDDRVPYEELFDSEDDD